MKRPWAISYGCAKRRCSEGGKYYPKGIKMLMIKEDFEFLWFRDKAYLLKKPSIDRIDSKGNYVLSNCRFIEHYENSRTDRKPYAAEWDENKTTKENAIAMDMSCSLAHIYKFRHKLKSKPAIRRIIPCNIKFDASKKQCINGHLLSEDSVNIRPTGYIECKKCKNSSNRAYRKRMRAGKVIDND